MIRCSSSREAGIRPWTETELLLLQTDSDTIDGLEEEMEEVREYRDWNLVISPLLLLLLGIGLFIILAMIGFDNDSNPFSELHRSSGRVLPIVPIMPTSSSPSIGFVCR